MIRFDFDGRQWRRAILPAGVRAEDHDAADRVIRWEPCEPPPHAQPPAPEEHERPWQSPLVESIIGVIGPGCAGLPAAGLCLAAVLAGWIIESAWRRRWVGPRWRMRSG